MNREQAQCLLGVAADATRKDVVSAHRRLISTVHPDKCSGPEAGRLARQATAARAVLLVPAEQSSRPPRPASPARSERVLDEVLLRYLRVIVDQVGGPVDGVELFRMFRSDLKARGVSSDDVRFCSARVLDDDFLAAGVARGFWELHGDGVRPVGWTEPSASAAAAGEPEPAAGSVRAEPVEGQPGCAFDPVGEVRRRVAEDVRRRVRRTVRWAAAVAATSLFGLGGVGCSGVLMGAVANGELLLAVLAVPVLFLCSFAGVWIMGRFGLSASVLGRPAVFVPGVILSAAFFLFLVA